VFFYKKLKKIREGVGVAEGPTVVSIIGPKFATISTPFFLQIGSQCSGLRRNE
jgi:hypothetical protein